MKNINGFKYSRKSFDGYKFRLKLEILDKENEIHNVDIYTTQINKDAAWDDLLEIVSKDVKTFSIIHGATKEQDDMSIELLNGWLKES